MSINGDRFIIKQIPVNAGYGDMIFDQSVVGIESLTVAIKPYHGSVFS
jgi:hypothetical protein